jgi:putative transposase
MHIQFSNTYFFTATALNWNLIFDEAAKNIIVKSLKHLVDHKKILVLGFVVMPNHLHILMAYL